MKNKKKVVKAIIEQAKMGKLKGELPLFNRPYVAGAFLLIGSYYFID